MAYVGNTSTTQAFTPAIDYFSGDGSTTVFTLSRPVASSAQVQVNVNNVQQNPTDAFTVLNNTITFTGAPSSGTNNIYVQYTSPITQVIQPGQGTVGSAQLQDGAVTTAKIANANVTIAKLSATGTASSTTYLRGDNTWATVTSLPGTQGQVFTSNGTFTIPSGITAVKVTVVGGGGGSGGSASAGSTGGGGGGGTSIQYLTSLTSGNTLTVTVGAGGTAGSSSPTAGGTGGTSSVASGTQTITTVSATGGAGTATGNTNRNGAAGGVGSGGSVNIGGGGGGSGVNNGFGGTGGSSTLGGGSQGSAVISGGTAGRLYGGGASGCGNDNTCTNISGAAGGAGVVIFEW